MPSLPWKQPLSDRIPETIPALFSFTYPTTDLYVPAAGGIYAYLRDGDEYDESHGRISGII